MKGISAENGSLKLLTNLPMPSASEDEVLVKVISTTMNPGDPAFALGQYDDFLRDELKSDKVKSGLEFAGVVLEGNGHFETGDRVFSYVDIPGGPKAHQEFVASAPEVLAKFPRSVSFDQAASVPCAAVTVLGAFRDVAKLQAGEKVLVIGASGGLGVFAIQMAKQVYHAEVTAVAGPDLEEQLKDLGADQVVNYRQQDILTSGERYDVILDLSCRYKFAEIKPLLSESGRFVPADPFANADDFKEGSEASLRTGYLFVTKGNRQDLDQIASWLEQGTLTAVIDHTCAFEEFDKALDRLEVRSKLGRIVLSMAHF